MTGPRYLVDTSAMARAGIEAVGQRLEGLALEGRLWTCRLVDLELAYAARAKDVKRLTAQRLAFPEAPITPAVMDRALQVAALMATRGAHRGAKPVDLVIAAAAEARGLAVLHYDADYERIAAVTRQPVEWVAERATLEH